MYENSKQHLIIAINDLDLGPHGKRYFYQFFTYAMESQADFGQDSLSFSHFYYKIVHITKKYDK